MATPPSLEELAERLSLLEQELRETRRRLPSQVRADIALGRSLHEMGTVPSAFAYSAAVQVVTDSSNPVMTLDTTWWDTDDMVDLANDRIQLKESGLYLCTASLFFDSNAGTDDIQIGIETADNAGTFGSVVVASNCDAANTTGPKLVCSGLLPFDARSGTSYSFVRAKIYFFIDGSAVTTEDTAPVGKSNHLSVVRVSDLPQLLV